MNIAIIIPELGGGGAERVAQRIGDYYVDKGYQVFYFTWIKHIAQAYPVKGTVIKTQIHTVTSDNLFGMPEIMLRLCLEARKLKKLKKDYNIGVAISFMEEANYLNILSRAGERTICRICTVLSRRSDLKNLPLYQKGLVRWMYRRSGKTIVLSEYGKLEMREVYKVPPKRISIVPNPILQVDDQNDERAEEKWIFGDKTILSVGRLEKVKRQECIINAFKKVYENDNETRLVLLGKGPEELSLKQLVNDLGLNERVSFIGFTNEVSYYMRHANVFILTSVVEGFPNVILEAMQSGCPIITTDIPGACIDILGNEEKAEGGISYRQYGLICDEKSIDNAVLQLLSDKRMNDHYRERSSNRAKDYQLERVMPLWDALVEGEV